MIIENPRNKPKTALIVGDTHHPWADKEYLEQCYERAAKDKPDLIFQMGDNFDFYCFSRYPGPIHLTPRDELEQGRRDAEEFWLRMKKASPRSTMIQLWGNHDTRLMKRVHDRFPAAGDFLELVDYKSFFRFPGVFLQEDEREEVKVDFGGKTGWVWFHHGHLTARAAHVNYNLENTVVGHTHRAELTWIPKRGKSLFEMNVGYVASKDSPVFRYSAQAYSKSVAGYGIIDPDGPRVVTFE
jgi:UDP-2,3-diacylglucosamine pyrophosphatase LpxH